MHVSCKCLPVFTGLELVPQPQKICCQKESDLVQEFLPGRLAKE